MKKMIWTVVLLTATFAAGATPQSAARQGSMQGEVTVAGAKLTPEMKAKVQASFHRRLQGDLKDHTVAQIYEAAEAAARDAVTPPKGGATGEARIKNISITISCCPLRIVITIEF